MMKIDYSSEMQIEVAIQPRAVHPTLMSCNRYKIHFRHITEKTIHFARNITKYKIHTENKISWIQVNLFTPVYLLLIYIIYSNNKYTRVNKFTY